MLSPSKPWTLAIETAFRKMAARVASPLLMPVCYERSCFLVKPISAVPSDIIAAFLQMCAMSAVSPTVHTCKGALPSGIICRLQPHALVSGSRSA